MPIEILRPDQLDQLRRDPAFRDIGAYVCDSVVSSLDPFVPPAFSWRNPETRDATTRKQSELTDVLFWHDDTCLLVECKGRMIPEHYEAATHHKKLPRWLDKTLSEARKQIQTALKYVRETPVIIGRAGSVDVIADLQRITKFVPAVVIFEITDFFWKPKVHERKMKYPEIQLFDLKGFYLATYILGTPGLFLSYLTEKQALSERHPAFLPYEENLLLYFLTNRRSLQQLTNASYSDLTYKFACGLPDKLPGSFLYSHSREEVYAALGLSAT